MEHARQQAGYRVRFDWGAVGAGAITQGASHAVVVDVLSFTTTLCVALEHGLTVFPHCWRDEGAAARATSLDAVLAVGRSEARRLGAGAVSLSPAAMSALEGPSRIVLPSPNGSAISFALRDSGATVLGACLRNATAAASLIATSLDPGSVLAVVAAGERWPDGSLRPAIEDQWGAGAVLAALRQLDDTGYSPEASAAADSFDAVRDRLSEALTDCASGRELVTTGFAEDVGIAAELDAATVVPVLAGDAFVPAS